MKLERVEIENYRAIERMDLPLHPRLTVLHGGNAHGKTSVLSAIAVGLGAIPTLLTGVKSVNFLRTDPRGTAPVRVKLAALGGIGWERTRVGGRHRVKAPTLRDELDKIMHAAESGDAVRSLPIVAFYDTDRSVIDVPQWPRDFKREFPRRLALEGALAARTNFKEFFEWFYAMENEELRGQRYRKNFGFRIKDMDAVRNAISALVSGVSNPHMIHRPLRFIVSVKSESGEVEDLELNQLSGGYRIMLALAADLARRMAQGNPHLDNPLQSEAIVLIDEMDLHLHPSWQQRILPDLLRTFPNTQFIVSTHSPQVLSTVRPENIVHLSREDGRIVAGKSSAPTYGAESGGVLEAVMRVDERPSGHEFVEIYKAYMELVYRGRGNRPEALDLRRKLEDLSPRDHGLDAADIEMDRQEVMKNLGRAP